MVTSSLITRGCTGYGGVVSNGKSVPFGFPDQSPPEKSLPGLKVTCVGRTLTDQAGSQCSKQRLRRTHFIPRKLRWKIRLRLRSSVMWGLGDRKVREERAQVN